MSVITLYPLYFTSRVSNAKSRQTTYVTSPHRCKYTACSVQLLKQFIFIRLHTSRHMTGVNIRFLLLINWSCSLFISFHVVAVDIRWYFIKMVKITSTPSYYRESFRNKEESSTFIFGDIFQNSLVFSFPHCLNQSIFRAQRLFLLYTTY